MVPWCPPVRISCLDPEPSVAHAAKVAVAIPPLLWRPESPMGRLPLEGGPGVCGPSRGGRMGRAPAAPVRGSVRCGIPLLFSPRGGAGASTAHVTACSPTSPRLTCLDSSSCTVQRQIGPGGASPQLGALCRQSFWALAGSGARPAPPGPRPGLCLPLRAPHIQEAPGPVDVCSRGNQSSQRPQHEASRRCARQPPSARGGLRREPPSSPRTPKLASPRLRVPDEDPMRCY